MTVAPTGVTILKDMAYPGNPELSFQAQERVTTAFRQAVAKLQDGQREEAMIGLEFVLRLDPALTIEPKDIEGFVATLRRLSG